MASSRLPVCAYLHRAGDEKDSELVELMIALEEKPDDPALVIRIIEKRILQGERQIAALFLEYARSLGHPDTALLDRLESAIGELN